MKKETQGCIQLTKFQLENCVLCVRVGGELFNQTHFVSLPECLNDKTRFFLRPQHRLRQRRPRAKNSYVTILLRYINTSIEEITN